VNRNPRKFVVERIPKHRLSLGIGGEQPSSADRPAKSELECIRKGQGGRGPVLRGQAPPASFEPNNRAAYCLTSSGT
jgi:hypothetical protein